METKLLLDALPAPSSGAVDLFIIAGEHSGDELAAACIDQLKESQPDLKIACLGGPKLKASGADLIFNLVDHSVVGLVDVLKNYSFFKSLFNQCLDWIERYRPKHICLVDYPGFNLRLAKALRKQKLSTKGGGSIGLYHYVSPQIWSWKSKRRFEMARSLDALAALLPFEKDCYADTNLPVTYVGHPFAETGYSLPVYYDAEGPLLMLPGSRVNAVEKIAPIIFEAFRQLAEQSGKLKGVVIYPSASILNLLEQQIERFPDIVDRIEFINKDRVPIGVCASIMSSGTMSLNMALASIPGVILYSMSPLNYGLISLLVRVRFIGLANIILDQNIYPELIQKAAQPEAIVELMAPFLREKAHLDSFIDASNALKHKLYHAREMSVSKWLEGLIASDSIEGPSQSRQV